MWTLTIRPCIHCKQRIAFGITSACTCVNEAFYAPKETYPAVGWFPQRTHNTHLCVHLNITSPSYLCIMHDYDINRVTHTMQTPPSTLTVMLVSRYTTRTTHKHKHAAFTRARTHTHKHTQHAPHTNTNTNTQHSHAHAHTLTNTHNTHTHPRTPTIFSKYNTHVNGQPSRHKWGTGGAAILVRVERFEQNPGCCQRIDVRSKRLIVVETHLFGINQSTPPKCEKKPWFILSYWFKDCLGLSFRKLHESLVVFVGLKWHSPSFHGVYFGYLYCA